MIGLFHNLFGFGLGPYQNDDYSDFQNRCRNDYNAQSFYEQDLMRKREYFNKRFEFFDCKCNQSGLAVCPIHPEQATSESGFVIDGECEDITNKRSLPKEIENG
jgi:hypothetical protein